MKSILAFQAMISNLFNDLKKIDLDKYLIPKLCFKVLGHLFFYRSPSFQNGMHLKILGSFITFTHILHSPWCVLELCHTLG